MKLFQKLKAIDSKTDNRTSALDFFNKLREIFYECELVSIYSDECIYVLKDEKKCKLICASHVDDILVLYDDERIFDNFYRKFNSIVETKDNGLATYFLGMEIDQEENQIIISQKKYAINLLSQYGFRDCKPVSSPMSTITKLNPNAELFEDIQWYQSALGAILYYTNTRPELQYVVGVLCKFISAPTVEHVMLIKRVFRYIKGTTEFGLKYTADSNCNFSIQSRDNNQIGCTSYADADFGNELHGNKSISGVMFFMGNNLVNWISRRQNRCADSTCEAEILSIQEAVHDVEYAKNLLNELMFKDVFSKPAKIFNDNRGAKLTIDKGGSFSSNRHYRIRINAIRDAVRSKLITVEHKSGKEMIADMLTKPLSKDQLSELLSMCNIWTGSKSTCSN